MSKPKTGDPDNFWDTVTEYCSLCGLYHPYGWQDRRKGARD